MPNVVVYTTTVCPFCLRAKQLLKRKGVDFKEIAIEGNREEMRQMIERSRRKTVPQIFVDDYHVGGYDDLAALDFSGKLDQLLGRPAVTATGNPLDDD